MANRIRAALRTAVQPHGTRWMVPGPGGAFRRHVSRLAGGASVALLAFVATAEPQAGRWLEPQSGIEFVRFGAGCFLMGHEPGDAKADADEAPRHEVCVDTFWIGRTEVTRGQWRRANAAGPTGPQEDDHRPIDSVSWEAAVAFAAQLSAQSPDGTRFRLPTEAEWEFACTDRGLPSRYAGDFSPSLAAWSAGTSPDWHPQPVAELAPTDMGLFDLSGNVHEWVADGYDPAAYTRHELRNPLRDTGGERRVVRGGSVLSAVEDVRCAARNWLHADEVLPTVGLRLVALRGEGGEE